jgi:hypothetical protein
VGHAGGDVRLYQFTDCAQGVHRVNLDETLLPYEHVGAQVGMRGGCGWRRELGGWGGVDGWLENRLVSWDGIVRRGR